MKLKKSTPKNITVNSLRTWNLRLAALYAIQAIVVLILSKGASWPITTNFVTRDAIATKAAGSTVLSPATHVFFNLNLVALLAISLAVAAIARTLVATRYRKSYEAGLKQGVNKAHWVEYALSTGVMFWVIAVLSGIYDVATLISIFGLVLLMNGLGYILERHNAGQKKVGWLPFWLSGLAGLLPWIVIALYAFSANIYGSSGIPAFVYYIYGSMFVLLAGLALNTKCLAARKGKWADYLYGEWVYMLLAFVAATALTWQVFFGALR